MAETKERTEKIDEQGQKAERGDPQIKDHRGDFAGPKEPVTGLTPESGQLMAHGSDLRTVDPLNYRNLQPHQGQLVQEPVLPAGYQAKDFEFTVEPQPQFSSIAIRIGLKDPQRPEIMRALALIFNNHDRPREAQLLLNTGVNYGNQGEWSGNQP